MRTRPLLVERLEPVRLRAGPWSYSPTGRVAVTNGTAANTISATMPTVPVRESPAASLAVVLELPVSQSRELRRNIRPRRAFTRLDFAGEVVLKSSIVEDLYNEVMARIDNRFFSRPRSRLGRSPR